MGYRNLSHILHERLTICLSKIDHLAIKNEKFFIYLYQMKQIL